METNEQVNDFTPEDEDGNSWRGMGFGSKVKYVCRNITVEPLLAFFQVSSVLSSLTTQNLNLQKACRVNLRMDDEVCHGLENKNMSFYAHQEVQVQQLVADMLIWQTMIQSSIPCILVIFIGSWSDRNRKRKPCMLVPVIGEIVRNIGLLLCVFYFDELKMEVAGLVESIPTSMAGGLTVLYLAAFSYMGDISSMKNRTLRVGLMNLFFGVAWPVGAALSGVLYQKLGFFGVYYISTALYVIAFIYGSVNIKEHPGSLELKKPTQRSKSCMYLVVDFFNLKHIKEAFHATFKKGPRRRWTKIVILMFTIIVIQGPSHGESGIAYFYTRVRFNWNELDYSLFSTFLFMTNIVGVGFSIGVLSHLLKLDDALIGVIACISKVLAGLVFAFAPSELYFYIDDAQTMTGGVIVFPKRYTVCNRALDTYQILLCLGAVVDVMSGTTYIVMRSILSKIVPHAELGQVSAIMAVIETIVPVVYKPLYSAIYRATLNTFPGTFYVISSIMLTPAIFVYWWMYHINNQEDKKTCTVEEIKSNDNLAFENN